jgi:hypothetical protein
MTAAPNDRARLIFHGAVVLLAGLLCGYPTVVESLGGDESVRLWHTAHEALIMMGVWMLAASSVLPALVLARREAAGLVWSLIGMGYGFMTALVIGGITGKTSFTPNATVAGMIAFFASAIGILGALLAAALTLMGARAALKSPRSD